MNFLKRRHLWQRTVPYASVQKFFSCLWHGFRCRGYACDAKMRRGGGRIGGRLLCSAWRSVVRFLNSISSKNNSHTIVRMLPSRPTRQEILLFQLTPPLPPDITFLSCLELKLKLHTLFGICNEDAGKYLWRFLRQCCCECKEREFIWRWWWLWWLLLWCWWW